MASTSKEAKKKNVKNMKAQVLYDKLGRKEKSKYFAGTRTAEKRERSMKAKGRYS